MAEAEVAAAAANSIGGGVPAVAAHAAVALISEAPHLGEQLLSCGLSSQGVLEQLLSVAMDARHGSAACVQRLLQCAEERGTLEQLPQALLAAAASAASSSSAQLPVLAALLQQGSTPDAAVTALLVRSALPVADRWHTLLQWLQEPTVRSPQHPAAVQAFVLDVLRVSCGPQAGATPQQVWQVFEATASSAQQWGLPAELASAALVRVASGDDADTTERALQLWSCFSDGVVASAPGAAAVARLDAAAQRIVVQALVASGRQQEAVAMAQQVPALLELLVQLWQQQAQAVPASLLAAALELALQAGTAGAAVVAGQLLALLRRQGPQPAAGDAAQLSMLQSLLSETALQQLVALACGSAGSSSQQQHDGSTCVTGLPSPGALAGELLAMPHALSAALAVPVLNGLAAEQPALQPAAAAALLGLLPQQPLPGAAASEVSSSAQQQQAGSEAAVAASRLLAQLCCALAAPMSGDGDDLQASLEASWVRQLTPQAAAATLFATWHHSQPAAAAAAVHGPDSPQRAGVVALPRPALGLLMLELYKAAKPRRGGKPSLDGLLLDLALLAAQLAACWDDGLHVVHTAKRVLAAAAAGEQPSSSVGRKARSDSSPDRAGSTWVPLLPAAAAALPAVLVRTQGVEATAQLLLHEHTRVLASTGAAAGAAAGRGRTSRGAAAAASEPPPQLLTRPVLNAFLEAARDVAREQAQQAHDAKAAADTAAAALRMAAAALPRQLTALRLAGSSADSSGEDGSSQALLQPDAATFALLAELHGLAGELQHVAAIVSAAVRQRLPVAGGGRLEPDALQAVLAGAAAAWLAAERADVAVALLDGLAAAGVVRLTHPGLAAQLLEAANSDEEGLAARLAGGGEVLYDKLPALADGDEGGGGAGVAGVQLAARAGDAAALLRSLEAAMRSAAAAAGRCAHTGR